MRPDIVREKIWRRAKCECGGDAPDRAKSITVLQSFPKAHQSFAVHEHDAVHELHLMTSADCQHLPEILQIGRARLFADNVFSSRGSAQYPLLPQACWKGNVYSLDFRAFQEFII